MAMVAKLYGIPLSLSKTLIIKHVVFEKMFDFTNDFGETEMPRGQKICKAFGVQQEQHAQVQCQKRELLD